MEAKDTQVLQARPRSGLRSPGEGLVLLGSGGQLGRERGKLRVVV